MESPVASLKSPSVTQVTQSLSALSLCETSPKPCQVLCYALHSKGLNGWNTVGGSSRLPIRTWELRVLSMLLEGSVLITLV